LQNFDLINKVDWEVPSKIIDTCLAKGQNENDCRNYITVLHEHNSKLLSCGTFAYSPNCSWRNIDNLSLIKYEKGVGKSPFNPRSNITTLMTNDGKMFIGSATDFSGADSAILRTDLSMSESKILRTKQYNSEWLNSPQFVGSFEHGDFIYFVFREIAVEVNSYGKAVYSRIARVCKNDNGGLHILKDNWTSFLKARLVS
jgi:semaphorin 5